jgi:hypothetical protein
MSSGPGRELGRCKIAWGKQRAELGGSLDRWFNRNGQQIRTQTMGGLCSQWSTLENETLQSPAKGSECPITIDIALPGTTIECQDPDIDDRYIINMDI